MNDGPRFAVAWSGGKDSLLALHRALERGYRVTHLVNLYHAASDRVQYHGVRPELIAAQAGSLGLELIQQPVGEDGFEPAFAACLAGLKELGIHGIIFGNIHLTDVRAWYEERTTAAGFEHIEPLWGQNPADLAREFLVRGHRTLIVSVSLSLGDPEWLGEELTVTRVRGLVASDSDPAGERGEYHTFSFDGPLFEHPIAYQRGEDLEIEGHRILDLRLGDVDDR